MAQVKRVNAAWERIEKWYSEKAPDMELGAGASAADITDVETHLGLTLPKELKASLMRHNGVENWTKSELLSTDRIKSEWDCWAGLVDEGQFDGQSGEDEDNDRIQKCWYDKKWIPLDADGGGNGNLIDLNPGPKGKTGQVIYMDHEVGPSGPVFSDLATYLEKNAEMLEDGKYRVEDGYLEEIDGDEEDEGEDLEEDDEEDHIESEDSDEEDEAPSKPVKKSKKK
jgi:cell wall assembly regulator SMI1